MSSTTSVHFDFIKRTLNFRFAAGTSRGVLKTRDVFWISASYPQIPDLIGWGEAAPLINLSIDHIPDFEEELKELLTTLKATSFEQSEMAVLQKVAEIVPIKFPSIRFGVETALLDLMYGGKKKILGNPFFDQQKPIPINGLIWMGDPEFMRAQIQEKIDHGFKCIKIKIGAIDFDQEMELLRQIRMRFDSTQIMLRVDANGAFDPQDAMKKLDRLAEMDIDSIEQPIRAGQLAEMKELCQTTPLPIALDEELIGVQNKEQLLDQIQPQHIIIKPTLIGGISETRQWIALAEERNIGWWMTSALESNIGLNAISQLASSYDPKIPQGLGTGKLFYNNLDSPLEISKGEIHYKKGLTWKKPA